MGESPYRSAYGVEDRVRVPSHEELALIDARREREFAVWKRAALSGPNGALSLAVVGLLMLAFGAVTLKLPVALAGALFALVLGGFGWRGRRNAIEQIGKRRGRWQIPDDQWRTHETRIRAHSVTYLASEDEDYTTWLLFEIPGGEWAAIDDLWVPPQHHGALPNADLVLTWLEPANECIGVQTHGGPLPRHGAVKLGEPDYEAHHFAQAVADGFSWRDEADEEAFEEGHPSGTAPIRRVPEAELPAWVRDAVGRD